MRAAIRQAGELCVVDAPPGWRSVLLEEAAPGAWEPAGAAADVEVSVRPDRDAFDTAGWEPVTRGVFRRGSAVVLGNACGSGFDLRATVLGDRLRVEARWRPPWRERAAAHLLSSRFRLLARAALLQYPAMWWAGRRRRVPLHAAPVLVGEMVALLAGPGGIGRSTLLLGAVDDGGLACSDNLCVSDGRQAWGVIEPVRIEGGRGRRMPHGRREEPLPGRVDVLTPDRLILLRRTEAAEPVVRPVDPVRAKEIMAAGTYLAGELRRYWPFAAALAAGTGIGPVHPPVSALSGLLARRLPAWEIVLGRTPGPGLRELLAATLPVVRS